jgi:hypothetical protein
LNHTGRRRPRRCNSSRSKTNPIPPLLEACASLLVSPNRIQLDRRLSGFELHGKKLWFH